MTDSNLDLSKLALNRSPKQTTTANARRRRVFVRYVLPLSLLLGFLALLGAAAGSHWLPKKSVAIVPVIVKRGEVQQEGEVLFQAAGWIEPRPTAVGVPALAAGVVEELLVVEGQLVEKDQPIARLIAVDAELSVEQSKATLAIREGELKRAKAEEAAAVIRLQQPVHLEVQLADANSMLAKATTDLDKLPFLVETAEANVQFTHSSLEGKRAAKEAIAAVVVSQAANDHSAALADLKELNKRGPNLKREVEALQEKVNALQQQLKLLVEENRQLQEANANVASSTALRDEAMVRLRRSQLNLDRTVVRSPMTGRVLRLMTAPGARVMGLEEKAGHSSSTVVEMYDPARLQVRADVRLEDVPLVMPNAPVKIETASSGSVILGRVLQSTSSANIQKNTLDVKVELIDPPPTVSPEMLVTATFLAPKTSLDKSESVKKERILVPAQLIQSRGNQRFTWVVDSDSRASFRRLTIGKTEIDGLIEVTEGLNVTDKLISGGTENLKPGDLVEVTGEDQRLGVGR